MTLFVCLLGFFCCLTRQDCSLSAVQRAGCFVCRWSGAGRGRNEATCISGLVICDRVRRTPRASALATPQTARLTVGFLSDVAKMKYFTC